MKPDNLSTHSGEAAQLLKELSNENRLMICCVLGEQELSVNELNQLIPLSQSALSQHLARLRDAELVSTRREKQTIFYSLCGKGVRPLIATLKTIYCP